MYLKIKQLNYINRKKNRFKLNRVISIKYIYVTYYTPAFYIS